MPGRAVCRVGRVPRPEPTQAKGNPMEHDDLTALSLAELARLGDAAYVRSNERITTVVSAEGASGKLERAAVQQDAALRRAREEALAALCNDLAGAGGELVRLPD